MLASRIYTHQNLIYRVSLTNKQRIAAYIVGCTVDFSVDELYNAAVRTNRVLIRLYIDHAKALGVEFDANDESFGKGLGASTDMGNVSALKPSIHPFYKIPSQGMNHTHRFTEASGHHDGQLPTLNSGKAMAMVAVDVICSESLLNEVRKDFTG